MSRYIDEAYIKAYPIRIDHYDEKRGNIAFVLGIESVMDYIDSAPTIKTKQIKYFDEEEKVWKIGEVIVDGEREGE